MKIGIIGGTFNPIHNGHLIISEYVRSSLNLDRVIFIPSGLHPFKDKIGIINAQKRIDMVSLAIESNENFALSRLEVDKEGISYTVDTMTILKEEYKNDQLYFIIGWDIVFELGKWKDLDRLSDLCQFILVNRPIEDSRDVNDKLEDLSQKYKLKIRRVETPFVDISSTKIRSRIKDDLSIRYLVPDSVNSYISDNNLYKEVE